MPDRIQLRRTRGWRKPAGSIVVSRPSRWGNPYLVGSTLMASGIDSAGRMWELPVPDGLTAAQAVALYREELVDNLAESVPLRVRLQELRGLDLACWCPLVDDYGRPVPCHADVLLELANA